MNDLVIGKKRMLALLMAALVVIVGLSIPMGEMTGRAEAASTKTVVIDPGHGMGDPGARGANGWEERAFNSILAYKTAKQLQARGVKVYLTHRVDDIVPGATDVPVLIPYYKHKYEFSAELAAYSNQVDPDLHLSIHHNSYNGTARGTETYYTSAQANPEAWGRAQVAAGLILDSVSSLGYFPRRSVKDFAGGSDAPIKYSNGPAVLLEACFIDNPTDCSIITVDSYANDIARKTADGIMQYLAKYPNKISEGNVVQKPVQVDENLRAQKGAATSVQAFTIAATGVNATAGVRKVQFNVERLESGSASKVGYAGTNKGGGRWEFRFDTALFGNQPGRYRFQAIVYDKNGQKARTQTMTVTVSKPVSSVASAGVLKLYLPEVTMQTGAQTSLSKFVVHILNVSAPEGVRSVSLRAKHLDSGSSYKFFQAKDRKIGNGSYQAVFDAAQFGNKAGTYQLQSKMISKSGKVTYSQPYRVTIVPPAPPTVGALRVYVPSNPTDWTRFKLRALNVGAPGGLKAVSFRVKNLTTNQTKFFMAKVKNGGQYFEAMFDTAMFGGVGGDYRIDVKVSDKLGRAGYSASQTVSVKGSKPPVAGYAIMGSQSVSETRMLNFFMANASKYNGGASAEITQYGYDGQGFPKYYTIRSNSNSADKRDNRNLDLAQFVQIFSEEAKAEGVKPEVAFAQMCHETAFLRFGGDVLPSQCNFAGLGAVGGGVRGESFESVRIGIRAQIQHLKAYASTAPLNKACVDQRFHYVARGSAPTVEGLTGTWAMDPSYATKILSFLSQM